MDPNTNPVIPQPPAPQPTGVQPPVVSQPATPPQPIASGTGDIILTPDAPRGKSRKPLIIIFIILGMLLAVGIAVAAFMLQRSVSSATVAESFNRYANYLLYGTDSAEPLREEYDTNKSYFIDEIIASDDYSKKQNFSSILLSKYQQLDRSFNDSNDANLKSELSGVLGYYSQLVYFMAFYIPYQSIDIDQLMDIQSQNELNRQIDNTTRYSNVDQNNILASQHIDTDQEIIKTKYQMVELGRNIQCIADNTFTDTCVENASFADYLERVQTLQQQNDLLSYQTKVELLDACWQIAQDINAAQNQETENAST